jgi:hypothetical protein
MSRANPVWGAPRIHGRSPSLHRANHSLPSSVRVPVPAPSATDLTPEQWVEEFRAWVHSHGGDDLPLLSDEAISRESIYRERGL